MLLEELFLEIAGVNYHISTRPGREKTPYDWAASKKLASDMRDRVQAQIDNVDMSPELRARIDKARADGDPELAKKIEDNYYDGEIGISGISPHERDIMMQTGMQQYYADRAELAAMTPEEKEAEIARINAENQKKQEAKEAEKKKKAEAKRKKKAEAERKRCENPNALLCP